MVIQCPKCESMLEVEEKKNMCLCPLCNSIDQICMCDECLNKESCDIDCFRKDEDLGIIERFLYWIIGLCGSIIELREMKKKNEL